MEKKMIMTEDFALVVAGFIIGFIIGVIGLTSYGYGISDIRALIGLCLFGPPIFFAYSYISNYYQFY